MELTPFPPHDPLLHRRRKALEVLGVQALELATDEPSELPVSRPRAALGPLGELRALHESDARLLPGQPLVLLLQVHKGVRRLVVPDVWRSALDAGTNVCVWISRGGRN